jgi:hypothetical protein
MNHCNLQAYHSITNFKPHQAPKDSNTKRLKQMKKRKEKKRKEKVRVRTSLHCLSATPREKLPNKPNFFFFC